MTGPRHPIPGVGVAVLNDAGELLLVRRGAGASAGKWAVPGGKVELGETLVEAARREVLEETGLDVEIGRPVWVGESIGPGEPPAWHFTLVDFVGRMVGGRLRAGDDAAEARWVDLDQVGSFDVVPTMPSLVDALRALP
jgi:mutator protein MutT